MNRGQGGPLAWVVGAKGLLGSHLVRAQAAPAGGRLWTPELSAAAGFSWSSPVKLHAELQAAAAAFVDAVVRGGHAAWCVYWAAGAGIVGSTPAALAAETAALGQVLQALGAQLDRLRGSGAAPVPGLFFLASSAGGVYGRCPDSPATEASPCLPVSDYGREKLRQEALLADWAGRHDVGHLIGRISNLYGPGQNLAKPQGLITHLVRSLVLDRPVHLYVPLDTLRDYIHVDDCAAGIVHAAAQLLSQRGAGPRAGAVKIFASEQPTSISTLIGIISRVTRRRPRVVYVAVRALTEQQPRRLTFRSTVLRPAGWLNGIGLPVGVSQVHRHLLERFSAGQLAPSRSGPG